MKVFITQPIPEKGLDILKKNDLDVTVWSENNPLSQEVLIDKLKGYDALICPGPYQLDKEFLTACRHLKVISLYSVGFDNVDVAAATQLKLPIGNTPGVLSKATADTAFLLMQMVARKASYYYRSIIDGKPGPKTPMANLGIDLEGKTLGVLGLGRIGYEMALKCKNAFGMKILYHNRHANEQAEKDLQAEKVSFDKLLATADVISIHTALTPETKGLFHAAAFARMKPTAILINTSRGPVVDEKALYAALKDGKIWGAGLDVTDPEPMQSDNPLLEFPTVTVFPHIGSATVETRSEMARLAAENVVAALQGKKVPNCINPEIYK